MQKAEVFLISLAEKSSLTERINTVSKILKNSGLKNIISEKDKTAVKIHVGEKHNNTHIKPEVIKAVTNWVKTQKGLPFLTETSTLYKGERSNAIDHLIHANRHGFTIERTGAPFIMADGLRGDTEKKVTINGLIHQEVHIAGEILAADALIALSHPTGHLGCGLAACIKNLGMGLSSRKGKLRQHSSIKPHIKTTECTNCGMCLKWCPENAIITKEDKAFIIDEKCIGCGECLAVCNFDAVAYNWGIESEELQRNTAEHALGVIKDKTGKCLFINVLANMTKECDCMNIKQTPFIPDIGVLASTDPVAIDQATLDLTEKKNAINIGKGSFAHLDPCIQLEHGEKIGLGKRVYELVQV